VRAAVQEGVSSLAAAYKGCSAEISGKLEALLLEGIKDEANAPVRLSAVQWASRLFPFHHPPARYICALGAGDTKLEVREESVRGLKLPAVKKDAASEGASHYPKLAAMLDYIAERLPRMNNVSDYNASVLMPSKANWALLDFTRRCWRSRHPVNGSTPHQSLTSYRRFIEHSLVRVASHEVQATALLALLEAAALNPSAFAAAYAARLAWLQGFLGHIDSEAREAAARLVGITAASLSADAVEAFLKEMMDKAEGNEEVKLRFEEREGAMATLGFVLAQCSTGSPQMPQPVLCAAASSLCRALNDRQTPLAAAAGVALGYAGVRHPLPLPDKAADNTMSVEPPVPATASTSKDANETKMDTAKDEPEPAEPSKSYIAQRVVAMLADKDPKVVLRAVHAAGLLCHGDVSEAIMAPLLDALLKLGKQRSEDVYFAAGEALVFVFGGLPMPLEVVLHSCFPSLAECPILKEQEELPPAPDTDMEGDGQAARQAAQKRILAALFDELLFSSRPEMRCSGAVWLVTLLKHSGRQPLLVARLQDIHEALSHLLGDPTELTQEMASRGMSLVYELGDEETRKELVGALVSTLSGGKQKRRAVKVTGDTQVFEEGAIGEDKDGKSLSTYQELCSLATEMGQPDLVYRFMDLANQQAALNSKRGAAFGFASIAKNAGEELLPHLPTLLPKLFRMQFDPNPRVQEAMGAIMRSLVDEPRKAVDEHYDAIMAECLKEIGARLWRSREEVGPHLQQIWEMTFRALDDIKESVRTAAGTLMRTIRGLTLRLCDVTQTAPSESTATVAVVLPMLLEKGIQSTVAEIRGLSVQLLMKIAKGVGKEQLRPHMPDLVGCMLESLSSLEDSRLNYMEQHAERVGISQEKLENARLSSSRGSPMADTLDLCARNLDAGMLEALVPKLVAMCRSGVGLNTRVGTASFITKVCERVGKEIKPHGGKLMQSLTEAARSENSKAVRKAYATACGTVAKYAAEKRVTRLVEDALTSYVDPGDASARHFAAVLLQQLSHQASDVAAQYATQILPRAFMAQFDEEADVAALFLEVWEGSTASRSASLQLYMVELISVCCEGLKSSSWPHKAQAAKAVAAMAKDAKENVAQHAAILMNACLVPPAHHPLPSASPTRIEPPCLEASSGSD
ncbi:hypothetical protein CYMTET_26979, partial [Cymbomonas tetramitiformis]